MAQDEPQYDNFLAVISQSHLSKT